MKKLTILLAVMLLGSSCTCLLSQIPPQYVLVGDNCQAPLPNYVPQVVVTDNCSIKSVVQTPAPGTILSITNPMVTVVIRATDAFDNFSEVSFTVTAKDSQPPVITPSDDLLADNWIKINNMYDQADKMVAEQEAYFDANFDWSSVPDSVRAGNQYNQKMMLTWTSPEHATTGYGSRVITFVSQNDTFTIK